VESEDGPALLERGVVKVMKNSLREMLAFLEEEVLLIQTLLRELLSRQRRLQPVQLANPNQRRRNHVKRNLKTKQ
jgi:hypothetical protein